jgi:acetyl esterase/lipase
MKKQVRSNEKWNISIPLSGPTPAQGIKWPPSEPLWPDGAPGAHGAGPEDCPTLTIFRPTPKRACGAAVVICPGGGYSGLARDHEGWEIARWLNGCGVTGVVLEYRMAGRGYRHPAPLQDAQRTIRILRARSAVLGIDPGRIGILGFSAGGHLASSAGTHFDGGDPASADPVERVSCRPDFMILCYSVITFGEPYSHVGSMNNLLGEAAPDELVRHMSSEKQVAAQTPPAFLFQTDEDTGVAAENSVAFYLALRRAHVPAELHVYRTGQHGLGLAAKTPGTAEWPAACERWMRGQGFLSPRGDHERYALNPP